MSRLLAQEEIDRQLRDLPGWEQDDDAIRAAYDAQSFADAVRLVVEVADEAEQMDHHPDLHLSWVTTTWTLSTHSEGGLTQLDFELAHRIAQAASRMAATVHEGAHG
ncbi:4a-hydroxytetrahydrobiopterin dehydratase [Leekyejoonella antrihumi]|uniref:Putative pterin-4-alpha-carbinolamine dehydratase n=1 Tax=Leekyejoonella antrihumi TaxID=1660198 RepID=A0A563DXA5_9MICO|nr:4a-hydroxytetrahydrobiopterin dehydratase [Leekyejoonella antrihumi]TWP34582.1 4a-hydroxytetrahydrobiopterin dehydratase [Leekyejoonella antrihumi]